MEQTKTYPPEYVKAVDAVLATPSGPRRWRKSFAIWLNLNPIAYYDEAGYPVHAKEQYKDVVSVTKRRRSEGGLNNRFGEIAASKTAGTVGGSGVRDAFCIPEGGWNFVKMFDRMAFDHNNPDCKKNLEKLYKEFKEFQVMETY